MSKTSFKNGFAKNIDLDSKRIKIIETDKLKVGQRRSQSNRGGIKVVYFD